MARPPKLVAERIADLQTPCLPHGVGIGVRMCWLPWSSIFSTPGPPERRTPLLVELMGDIRRSLPLFPKTSRGVLNGRWLGIIRDVRTTLEQNP